MALVVKPYLPVDVYIRVSRVGGREHLISPEEQEHRARTLARERGLRVGKILTDLDESGGKLDRPGLQEALRRVEGGESGGVIVAWLDRLSRDSEQALGLVRRISDAGGVIYAPDAPSDWTTPEGGLQAGIVFTFATYVRMRARAGFERAKERAIANGIPVHSRPAVGYRARQDRRLEPDPDVAPVIREVFERRARGEGPAALGAFLTERGITTSQGSRMWSKEAIYGLLRNRVYLGELSYGLDRRFVNPDAHEAIVDLATWQAAQHPNGRRLAPARSEGSEFLLTGIARCSGCGYSLQATKTSRGKRIYRCGRTHAGGICPAPVRIDAGLVEAAAVEAFWSLTRDLEAEGTKDDRGELKAIERQLERAEHALKQWTSIEVQEAIGDTSEYAAGLRERRQARDEAAAKLGSARVEPRATVKTTKRLRSEWQRATPQERRELLGLRLDTIALGRDRRMVVYAAGTGPTDLPRRGFKRDPSLAPFPDAPSGARVLRLETALKPAGNRGV
jgi:DNA invertase Pin-like site-specific DNA recombinase